MLDLHSHDPLLIKCSGRHNFEAELYALLSLRINRFTMGDSSSVTVACAESLLRGILYCIDLHLRLHPDVQPDDWSLESLFLSGVADVRRLVRRGKLYLHEAVERRIDIENIAYEDTLCALQDFFLHYDPDYFAHEIPCSIDYPLCTPICETLYGIEYIIAYLRRLNLESALLRLFDRNTVLALLNGYCGGDLGLLFNLYTPVAESLIGRALAGLPLHQLGLTPFDRDRLLDMLMPWSNERSLLLLSNAVTTCSSALELEQSALSYLQSTAGNLLPRMRVAALAGDLQGVFPSSLFTF